MIALIFFIIIIAVAIIANYVYKAIRKSYIKFVSNNSILLEELQKLNSKYHFYDIDDFDEEHVYDNENYFDTISCEDYLIYQLQLKKYKVEKEIKCARYNDELYVEYKKDIFQFKKVGEYKKSTKYYIKSFLIRIEKELYYKNLLKPQTNFNITIFLYCSTLRGYIYCKKRETFSEEEILSLIKRLNNKNNNFYNDKEIWNAICRVERGRVSNKMRFAIYERDGYRCCNCGRGEGSDDLEIDHIKPIAKGGKSTFDNLQTLCKRCNKEKGDSY